MQRAAQAQPACTEKKHLLEEYEAATTSYYQATEKLRRKMGTSPKSEYDRLFQATEDARAQSELARAKLLQHVREHRC